MADVLREIAAVPQQSQDDSNLAELWDENAVLQAENDQLREQSIKLGLSASAVAAIAAGQVKKPASLEDARDALAAMVSSRARPANKDTDDFGSLRSYTDDVGGQAKRPPSREAARDALAAMVSSGARPGNKDKDASKGYFGRVGGAIAGSIPPPAQQLPPRQEAVPVDSRLLNLDGQQLNCYPDHAKKEMVAQMLKSSLFGANSQHPSQLLAPISMQKPREPALFSSNSAPNLLQSAGPNVSSTLSQWPSLSKPGGRISISSSEQRPEPSLFSSRSQFGVPGKLGPMPAREFFSMGNAKPPLPSNHATAVRNEGYASNKSSAADRAVSVGWRPIKTCGGVPDTPISREIAVREALRACRIR